MTRCKVHKYLLATRHGDNLLIYRCASCTHYLPAEDAEGLNSICWRCGGVCKIPLGRPNRKIKRPHCISCTKVYKDRPQIDVKALEAMSIEDLLKDEE